MFWHVLSPLNWLIYAYFVKLDKPSKGLLDHVLGIYYTVQVV